MLALILDIAHVTAAAVWIGGLAALALALWTGDGRLRLPLARRFSGLALVSVVLLAGTGVGRALEELDSFSQLWTTGYGRAILVKTGLLVVLVALAARNRLLFLSGPLSGLRRGVTAEVVVLLGLVVAIAVLTALPPGRTSAAAARLLPVPIGPAAAPAAAVWRGRAGGASGSPCGRARRASRFRRRTAAYGHRALAERDGRRRPPAHLRRRGGAWLDARARRALRLGVLRRDDAGTSGSRRGSRSTSPARPRVACASPFHPPGRRRRRPLWSTARRRSSARCTACVTASDSPRPRRTGSRRCGRR